MRSASEIKIIISFMMSLYSILQSAVPEKINEVKGCVEMVRNSSIQAVELMKGESRRDDALSILWAHHQQIVQAGCLLERMASMTSTIEKISTLQNVTNLLLQAKNREMQGMFVGDEKFKNHVGELLKKAVSAPCDTVELLATKIIDLHCLLNSDTATETAPALEPEAAKVLYGSPATVRDHQCAVARVVEGMKTIHVLGNSPELVVKGSGYTLNSDCWITMIV